MFQPVRATPDLVHHARLEIEEDGTGDVLAGTLLDIWYMMS